MPFSLAMASAERVVRAIEHFYNFDDASADESDDDDYGGEELFRGAERLHLTGQVLEVIRAYQDRLDLTDLERILNTTDEDRIGNLHDCITDLFAACCRFEGIETMADVSFIVEVIQ